MADKAMSLAGQYSASQAPGADFMQRVQQAFEAMKSAGIASLMEIETGSQTVRVLVEPSNREAARAALKDILPNIPRRLKMRVDANSLRRVTPASPTLMPDEEVYIGASSVPTYKEKLIVISDDSKIARQHLGVRWDGLNKLEIKDVSGRNDARIDTVEVGPEWMEVEPGAKIRIGDTTVSFQLGEPVS